MFRLERDKLEHKLRVLLNGETRIKEDTLKLTRELEDEIEEYAH